jgi:hypothetical protein
VDKAEDAVEPLPFEKLEDKVPPGLEKIVSNYDVLTEVDHSLVTAEMVDPSLTNDSESLIDSYLAYVCHVSTHLPPQFAPPWGKLDDYEVLRKWSVKVSMAMERNIYCLFDRRILTCWTRLLLVYKLGLMPLTVSLSGPPAEFIADFIQVVDEFATEALTAYRLKKPALIPSRETLELAGHLVKMLTAKNREEIPDLKEIYDDLTNLELGLYHRWARSAAFFITSLDQVTIPDDLHQRLEGGESISAFFRSDGVPLGLTLSNLFEGIDIAENTNEEPSTKKLKTS